MRHASPVFGESGDTLAMGLLALFAEASTSSRRFARQSSFHSGQPLLGDLRDGPGARRDHRALALRHDRIVHPHGCRHTFASLAIAAMAAAGKFNPKVIQHAMGHKKIQMTYDRYGHMFPGTEAGVGGMLDRYLAEEAAERLRIDQLDG